MAHYLFYFLIFPGFFFTAISGLFTSWADRKMTARMQWRVGPPVFQPLFDLAKLLGKEVIVPTGSRGSGFLLFPLIGLAGVTLASTILCLASWGKTFFVGDLIGVMYLLALPPLAVILGGGASGNPLSGMGASREAKLFLSFELPMIICKAIVVMKAGYTLNLAEIAGATPLYSISGFIALAVFLLGVQARLGFGLFDITEADTEIMAGPYVEYSGGPLAVYKLTQAMMLFALPVYAITLFWGGFQPGWAGLLWGLPKYAAIAGCMVFLKNFCPRIRIDQGMTLMWKFATAGAVMSLILAILGKTYGIAWL